MRLKVEEAVRSITAILREWPSVDTVTMLLSGEDVYDAYFFVSLDVYSAGEIPDADERSELFAHTGAFESSSISRKDRFLLDDIPFRIEYKDIARFDFVLSGESESGVRDSGTYTFHRLLNSEVLYQRTDWIDRTRRRLAELPDSFWKRVRSSFESRMEHYLGDLSAAVVRDDRLFFVISSAGFIRSVCSTLFAVNKRFEPSARSLARAVLELPVLPEPFEGRFDSFLRDDADLTWERKREIAELIARSILAL